jgi:hypothetical protein
VRRTAIETAVRPADDDAGVVVVALWDESLPRDFWANLHFHVNRQSIPNNDRRPATADGCRFVRGNERERERETDRSSLDR